MKLAAATILLFLSFTSLSEACCPSFWSQFKGTRCYRYVGLPLTWFEAREYCYHFSPGDSHLVTINSAEEATHLHRIFEENGAEKHSSYWIGLRDFHKNQRRFEWDDGTAFKSTSYAFWYKNEPNNNGVQDCVEVYRTDRRWNDRACTTRKPFICEMKRP